MFCKLLVAKTKKETNLLSAVFSRRERYDPITSMCRLRLFIRRQHLPYR